MCQNKRKRIKLECLTCGSIFYDDFKKNMKLKVHNHGKYVKVKHLTLLQVHLNLLTRILKK